jgi:hypothetical protein
VTLKSRDENKNQKNFTKGILFTQLERIQEKFLWDPLDLIKMADKGDQYEEYNYDEGIHSGNARKGKSKKEAAQNKSVSTQGHNERKVAGNIQHGEEKRKEEAIKNMDKEK